jgi:hypothetical protein
MTETSFIGTFVNNHSIFHVITCVGDNSHDCIGATWVLSEVILLILVGVDQGLLREEDTIDLVIHAIGVVVVGCTHGLLGHLALIHITRRLIVLRERLHGGDDTQNVHGVQLLMSSVRSDVFFLACDRKVQLL